MNARPWLTQTRWAVLDIESTSADPKTCEPLEIAVGTVDDGRLVSIWRSYVRPRGPIPEAGRVVHGIHASMVADAPAIEDVRPVVEAACKDRVLLGYNLGGFDLPVLHRYGFALPPEFVDVFLWILQIDRWVKGKGRFRLGQAAARWGVELKNAHTASGDLAATWELWRVLVHKKVTHFPPTLEQLYARQRVLAEQRLEWLAERAKQAAAEAAEAEARAREDDISIIDVADGSR
jgi:DNA polymerase III epsilon subunit-like protein